MNCRFFGACFSLFETQKQGHISKTGFVLESFLNKSGADAPVAYSATFATAPFQSVKKHSNTPRFMRKGRGIL